MKSTACSADHRGTEATSSRLKSCSSGAFGAASGHHHYDITNAIGELEGRRPITGADVLILQRFELPNDAGVNG